MPRSGPGRTARGASGPSIRPRGLSTLANAKQVIAVHTAAASSMSASAKRAWVSVQ